MIRRARRLTDAGLHDAVLLHTELHRAALRGFHRALDLPLALRFLPFFPYLPRLFQRIKLGAVDALADGRGTLSELDHGAYPATSIPIERAEPSTMRIAASMVSQFKSFIFCWAISRTCALVTVPARSRPGVFDPLSSFAAFLMKKDTDAVPTPNKNHPS